MAPREEAPALLGVGAVLLERVEQLAPDDSDRPNVDLLAVVFLHENQFWSAIKPGRNVTCELPFHVQSYLAGLLQNESFIRAI